jgi:hypothetical protein
MSAHTSEIIIGISGVIAASTAWFLGGKQVAKNSERDTLTKGADQIVETSGKLLLTLEKMLEEEREHKKNCENSLAELKLRLDQLERKL